MDEFGEKTKRDVWAVIKKKVHGRIYVQYYDKYDTFYIKVMNKDFSYDMKFKNFSGKLATGMTVKDITDIFMKGYSSRIDMVSKRKYLKFQRKGRSRNLQSSK